MDKKKQGPKETHFTYKDTYKLKVKDGEKIYYANSSQKKVRVAILISEQTSDQGKWSGKKGII